MHLNILELRHLAAFTQACSEDSWKLNDIWGLGTDLIGGAAVHHVDRGEVDLSFSLFLHPMDSRLTPI